MRRLCLMFSALVTLSIHSSQAQAQVSTVLSSSPIRINDPIGMPGLYGTSWGVASFGVPRTYSNFSSSYGAGYGYGYSPSGVMPGKFGVGLWRPGFVAPGYTYGSAYGYNTFPYPYKPGGPKYRPSIGVYAPGFGPGGQPPALYAH